MAKVFVFQYGSNCNTRRLNSPCRLGGKACSLGKAKTVVPFKLVFNVWSTKNDCAAADLIRCGDALAWGVLYEIPEDFVFGSDRVDGCKTLTEIEGPNYEPRVIRVTSKEKTYCATTFLVKKSKRRWDKPTSPLYAAHIVKGLRDHGVCKDYVDSIIATAVGSIALQRQVDAAKMACIKRRIEEEVVKLNTGEAERSR